MIQDTAFHEKIEKTVGEVEETTSAEVVVALATRSGTYRDSEMLAGFLMVMVGSILGGLQAWRVGVMETGILDALLIPIDALVLFLIGFYVCRKFAALRRLITTARRRSQQARTGGMLAFHEEGVGATRERNGILFYVSLFEDAVEIVPDLGIEGRVQGARWNELRHALGKPSAAGFSDRFIEALTKAGPILAEAFPPGDENPDEIPNRPRIRS